MELPETEHMSDVERGRSCMILPGARSRFSESLQHCSDTAPTCVNRVRLLFMFQYSIKLFSKVFFFSFSINIGIL